MHSTNFCPRSKAGREDVSFWNFERTEEESREKLPFWAALITE